MYWQTKSRHSTDLSEKRRQDKNSPKIKLLTIYQITHMNISWEKDDTNFHWLIFKILKNCKVLANWSRQLTDLKRVEMVQLSEIFQTTDRRAEWMQYTTLYKWVYKQQRKKLKFKYSHVNHKSSTLKKLSPSLYYLCEGRCLPNDILLFLYTSSSCSSGGMGKFYSLPY